jgi:hypothetical protein
MHGKQERGPFPMFTRQPRHKIGRGSWQVTVKGWKSSKKVYFFADMLGERYEEYFGQERVW